MSNGNKVGKTENKNALVQIGCCGICLKIHNANEALYPEIDLKKNRKKSIKCRNSNEIYRRLASLLFL